MDYRLSWFEHWSEQRESLDPRVITRYAQQPDGWYEHEHIYYFMADDDKQAREKALKYINESSDTIEVFSVFNRKTKEVILTEEEI
jgi:hypothetical protein